MWLRVQLFTKLREYILHKLRCKHRKMSRVFTVEKRQYVVCLDCGDTFDYNWTDMKVCQ